MLEWTEAMARSRWRSFMDCIDCYEATARLHLYLDRELSAEEIEIVQEHLAACPRCTCRFRFDLQIKRLIHERCHIAHAPEHLRDAVMRIAHTPRGELVAIDADVASEIRADLLDD
jgi:anti-sigma factor (TIGR02949 family)